MNDKTIKQNAEEAEAALAATLMKLSRRQLALTIEACAAVHVLFYIERNPVPDTATPEEVEYIQRTMVTLLMVESINRAGQVMIEAARAKDDEQSAKKMADAAIARASAIPGNETKH